MKTRKETRGFRNNNPGNIRHGDQWKGLRTLQTDDDFCQFECIEYGIRAIFRILTTYRQHFNILALKDIIHRWAPPNENKTEAYLHAVCHLTRLQPDTTINPIDYPIIVDAIMYVENGYQPLNVEFIRSCRGL